MTLVTTINGGPNLVTTVQAAPVSGAALTVVGVLSTALSVASTPVVVTEVNIGRPGPAGPPGPGSTWGGIVGTLADQTDLSNELNAKLASAAFTWSNLPGKPTEFTPSAHGHVIGDVTGLQAALDGKQAAGSYAAASHVHTIANVTGLQAALDAKQPSGSYASASHTHAISDVTGLSSALSAKLDVASFTWTGLGDKPSTFPPDTHGHNAAAISDFSAAARAQIEAMLANGTNVSFSFAGTGATRVLTINASGGSSASIGTAVVNFGADPVSSQWVELVVVDASVTALSKIEAWLNGSTADNNAYEHSFVPMNFGVVAIDPGVGFTLLCTCEYALSGDFQIAYRIN